MKRKTTCSGMAHSRLGKFLLQGMVFKGGKLPEEQFGVLCYSYWKKNCWAKNQRESISRLFLDQLVIMEIFYAIEYTFGGDLRKDSGGFKEGTRGSCLSLDKLKQVWHPFFGNYAPHLKNENLIKI